MADPKLLEAGLPGLERGPVSDGERQVVHPGAELAEGVVVTLHQEQGIVATTYRDIARRADVGLGTVYHHFPAIDDLVMACGGRLAEVTRPPTPGVFTGLRSRRARLERLAAEVFAWYERYPQWRRAICDADKLEVLTRLEVLARGVQRREGTLRELVEAALGADADPDTVATVRAVLDFEVYRSLVDADRTTAEAAASIAKVLLSGI